MGTRREWIGVLAALAPLSALAACQMAPAPSAAQPVAFVPIDGVGYIFLNAPILPQSRDLLLKDMDGLIAAGARTIRFAINSPGGELGTAQSIVDYITNAHLTRGIQFETFDVGMVSSAATYVFLSAQRRYARAGTGFLFHAAGLVSNGMVSAERLREEANKIDSYERAVRALLKSRTRLTDGAIDVYLHRTVILTADDAQRDGVVDGIASFTVPPNARVITIAARPTAAPQPGATQPQQPNGR